LHTPGTDGRPTDVRPEVALEVGPPRRLTGIAVRLPGLVVVAGGQDEQRAEGEGDRSDDEREPIEAGLRPEEQMQRERGRKRHRNEEPADASTGSRPPRGPRRSRGEADHAQGEETEKQGQDRQSSDDTALLTRSDQLRVGRDLSKQSARTLIVPMNTRVVIAEDHPLMLSAITETLERADGFAVAGSATSGLQVEPLVSRTRPDLVLLDIELPGLDGLSCLALLRERHPNAKVVIFSGSDARETIEKALRGGAVAYVNKAIAPPDLPAVLRQALAGNVYFSTPSVAHEAVTEVMDESRQEHLRRQAGLTARELEILRAVACGLSNRAVGEELFLSDQTVKFHLHKIYRKLRVSNRTEATRLAHGLGLIPDLALAA
jgi:DNA-binding NarL/FixJ family response regulator